MTEATQAIVNIPRGGGCKSIKRICSQLEYLDQDEDVVLELSERHGGAQMSRQEYEDWARLWAEQTGHFLDGESLYDGDQDLTTHIIVSFPPGTEKDRAYAAGRAWAEEVFGSGRNGGEWDYVTGFHTNKPHPHLHVIVNRRSLAARGEWLAISHRNRFLNYDTLRETLADAAYDYGIELDATSRAQRGLEGRGPTTAEYRRNAKVQIREHFEDRSAVVDLATDGQREVFPELTGVKPQSGSATQESHSWGSGLELLDEANDESNHVVEEERALVRADSREHQERAMQNDELRHRANAGPRLRDDAVDSQSHGLEARAGVVNEYIGDRVHPPRVPVPSTDKTVRGAPQSNTDGRDYDAEAERQLLEETERSRSSDGPGPSDMSPESDVGMEIDWASDDVRGYSADQDRQTPEQLIRFQNAIDQQLTLEAEQYRQRQMDASRKRRESEDLRQEPLRRRKQRNLVPDEDDESAAYPIGPINAEAPMSDAGDETKGQVRGWRRRPKAVGTIETKGESIRRRAADKQSRKRGEDSERIIETRAQKRSRLKKDHDARAGASTDSMALRRSDATNPTPDAPRGSPAGPGGGSPAKPKRNSAGNASANGAANLARRPRARTAERSDRNPRSGR